MLLHRVCYIAACLMALSPAATADSPVAVHSVLIRLIDEVEVPARATGALAESRVREGSAVKAGELLARIDSSEAELERQRAGFEQKLAAQLAQNDVALRSAEKAFAFAQADYGRLQRAAAAQPRSVSQSELEKARLDMEQAALDREHAEQELSAARLREKLAAAALAMAERQVEIRSIVAPLDGVVVSMLRKPGEWVAPGDKILRIVRTDRLRAEGFLDADNVPVGLQGTRVMLVPEQASANPSDRDQATLHRTSFPATVTFVSPEVDPVNGQVRVLAEVENPEGLLRPGLRMQMTLPRQGLELSSTR